MYPVVFNIGPLAIHSFGVLMALGMVAGLVNWTMLGKTRGRDFAYCSDLLVWIIVSGVLGARIASVVSEWDHYVEHPTHVVRIDKGGLIFYGGFVAATVAMIVFSRIRRERFIPLTDFVITSIPLAHVFGRVGCFLNGCCHGIEYDGIGSVVFPGYPDQSPAWISQYSAGHVARDSAHSLPVHPVQLYEAAFNLLVYAVVLAVYRRSRRAGFTAAVYLFLYSTGRFFLEFLRGDERMPFLGISVAQAMSIGIFGLGIVFLLASGKTPRPAAAPES